MTKINRWYEYEMRKRIISQTADSAVDYENKLALLVKQLGL